MTVAPSSGGILLAALACKYVHENAFAHLVNFLVFILHTAPTLMLALPNVYE